MSHCSKHHMELDETGVGKCSVPMWRCGLPAGFCDEPAYGKPTKCAIYRDGHTGELFRADGKYNGYVPGLACPAHGGPKGRQHWGNPCKYCGTPHDDVEPGPCPGRNENCRDDEDIAPDIWTDEDEIRDIIEHSIDFKDVEEMTQICPECNGDRGHEPWCSRR